MVEQFLWLCGAYLCGSVMFADLAQLLFHRDLQTQTSDHNPGAANAFSQGGIAIGIFTLLGDILKGVLPVALYLYFGAQVESVWLALMLVMPVLGHAFPIFFKFSGGKGIAVTFGVLLGLLPIWQPVVLLALCFITFSNIIKVRPDYYLTATTYVIATLLCWWLCPMTIALGLSGVSVIVGSRLLLADEIHQKVEVKLGWKH